MILIVFLTIIPINSTQNFDGLFTMDVPVGQHYTNDGWCWANGGLGCKNEYWEDNAGCEIEQGDMVVYYYNNSVLVEGESNAWQHAINGLTTSYFYTVYQNDGDLIILTNDLNPRKLPLYLVGKANDDGSEVVFVGGYDLDKLKTYANSVKFN